MSSKNEGIAPLVQPPAYDRADIPLSSLAYWKARALFGLVLVFISLFLPVNADDGVICPNLGDRLTHLIEVRCLGYYDTHNGTIRRNDGFRFGEGYPAKFTFKRVEDKPDFSKPLTIHYRTTGSTRSPQATPGVDYTSTNGTLTFAANEIAAKSFEIDILHFEGDIYEVTEYFGLEISVSVNDVDQGSQTKEIQIFEKEQRHIENIGTSPIGIPETEGTNNKQITFKLNKAVTHDFTIKWDLYDSEHRTATVVDGRGGEMSMADIDLNKLEGSVTFPAGATSHTVNLEGIIDDNIPEPEEQFALRFSIDSGNAFNDIYFESEIDTGPLLSTADRSFTIEDDDPVADSDMPIVYLHGQAPIQYFPTTGNKFPSTRIEIAEGGGTNLTATLKDAPTENLTIPLKVTGFPSNAVNSSDYELPDAITITAGKKSGTVDLKIKRDNVDERHHELLAIEIDKLKMDSKYEIGDRNRFEVIMVDSDKTKVDLLNPSATTLTEAEGAREATFKLRIGRRPKADTTETRPFEGVNTNEDDAMIVLSYMGTATRDDDYTLTPIEFSIPKSPAELPSDCKHDDDDDAVTCTVTLKVIDDDLYERGSGTTENVIIKLDTGKSSFTGGITTPSGLNLTIEDDDPQPMFSIADVSGPEGGNITFTVERSGARGNNVSVTAGTTNHAGATNSATADTDYSVKTGKTLNFLKNDTSETFVVATTDDNIHELDETFAVKLSKPVDNQGLPEPAIDDGTAIGTISDNDDAPTQLTISVDTDTSTDGNQNTIAEAADKTTVSVTATIDSPTRFATDQTVTVTVGKEGDKAVEGTDYAEVAGTIEITIPATEKSGTGTFELTPVNDEIDDDGEKISVEGALGTMTVTHAAINIEDDDTRGIAVSKATLTIDEADDEMTNATKENEGTYEVVLKSEPTGTVTVTIANEGTKVATVKPSSLTFDKDNWEMAQMVTVLAEDDTIDDTGDQKTTTISHTVSAAGTDYEYEEVKDVAVTVIDDDEAPTALTITVDTDTGTDSEQNTISEGAGRPTVRITATLDGDTQFATNQTITITVGADGDSATEGQGGDYATVDNFEITLPAKAASVTHDLTLTISDDTVDEPDETVTVTGELDGVTVTDTMFTIVDNDATPTVTLVLTPASINESGATNASTITATMDGNSSDAVTLTVSATPVSPAVAGDLTLSDNKTLTIPANTQASTGVVTIAAVDNDVDAEDKTVTVSATATGGNALVKAPGSQTLTITDDDTRGITVSKATLTLDEEDNTATMEADEHQNTYTVVLDSEPSGGTVTIGVASGDTNIAGVAPATLTFTASNWDEPQTVTVTAVPDGIDNEMDRREATISHTVSATGTDYDGVTASGVTFTVNDDDGPSTLSINSPSVTEVDGGATATLTFTVQLKPESDKRVTVDYADTRTGTATSGNTDYATLASGTLTFMPSETSKSVAVTVSGDDIDELDETVVVRLSSPSNATLTGGVTTLDGTGTINDNDPTPTVSIADAAAVSEGNVATPDSPNNMTFVVTLSAVSGLEVTVPYTLSGTATAGTDYTEPDPRSITIDAGTMQEMIKIPVAGDQVDEENETIAVTLGTPTNATISTAEGEGAASGTITDDDTRGVSVTPTALTVAEADNAGTAATREDQETYEVVLTSQPTGAVTVNLNSGDESVARIDTASLVFDADDWNTERTVTVTGQADVIDNTGDERTTTIAHTVSAVGTDYASETAEGVTVTVTDDDAAPSGITLTANPDSVTENGGAKTITVTAAVNDATRYAQARTVSVSVGGGTAISGTDYTAVESFDITIGAGEDDASNTFTLTPENDVLAEGDETIDVTGTLSGITITPDEITLTDNDAAPSGITLNVDTNGTEDGTPSTVAEDAGATVVTVTATVNGETRYVEAKTVAVSVVDGTAASPADYAAVNNFNITIAAGAASQTGSFTVTPVDDDLDESNETINVTGTLSSVTVTGATVTFTDNDDPVSFSIADAEATEGGKVEFTVRRAGARDNVASVKVTTATDSSDGANAADADDYTAISTAQTVSFAAGIASQMVEVQTTQDDLFEPDETFLVNLSAPALGDEDPGTGVSIEADKGTATGTIKNDDTEPSFAVADASASEGDGITFTVTRLGAMDNAVSVKWNTKPDTGAGAESDTDYTPVTTAQTLTFAKGVSSQTFTVATTEDVLAEGNETFLVELTGAVGGTISTAEATGTINDDDAAPTGITLSVDADTDTNNVQSSIAEEGGVKTVRVTATIDDTTRFATAQTVTVTVGKDGDSATEGTDYSNVAMQSIEIPIGAASAYVDFPLTPTTDVLSEGSETISVEGTLTDVTFTNATITITDDDAAPSAITLSVDADTDTNNVQSSIAEEGGVKTVRVTATIVGTTRFATAQTVTVAVGKDGDSATEGTDYSNVEVQSIEIPIGAASAYVDFMLTPTTDVLFEGSETISVEGTLTGVTFNNSSITITDDDAAPSVITLSVDTNAGGDGTPTTLGEGAATTTVRVTATITSTTRFATEQMVKVKVGKDGDSATEGTDYALVADQSIKIPVGAASAYVDFSLTPTHDILDEPNETISVDGELTGVTFTPATITINDDDAAPQFITLAVDTNAGGNGTPTSVGEEAGATTVRVTATITSATRFEANQAVTFEVGKSADSATESTDYTEVGTLTITIDGGEASGYVDFTFTPTSDVLDEPNETISVHGTQASITFTDATITITDDDATPTGITLSVDTNGSTSGTPDTVAEDAGATVVTVTATVNGATRYVDAKTVAVSVVDNTATSPADYAAVSSFNITIAAGAASHTGSFTVTPVDDDLDESNEMIDVTGTLSSVTITGATVTLTDNDDPVSFSIADAEATEGGKIAFTVSRSGAEDNVASVKIATAADSGDGVNAASTSDYTAIATAQTLNFAKDVTSQMVEVQTTQDDLFEPDETFKAVLSAPALGDGDPGTAVSIATGEGTATGTIKNDDTEPSFAVADASASEGDAITFTVTRSGAMDNVVSVKWNTKAATGAGAASATDYTPVTTGTTLTFAKDVDTQTFTVATTEDNLHEGNETFLVKLTAAEGGTISDAEATGTITDDDAAPGGITLSVDTNGSTAGTPSTVAEDAGATVVTVTATVNGETRYVEAKTVAVSVADGTAASPADYAAVSGFNITIAAGAASQSGSFTVTPVDDDLDESNETIDVTGTLTDITITGATVTLTDNDDPVSFSIADAEATEGGKVMFTVSRAGAEDNVASVKIATAADSGDGVKAADADDYTVIATAQTLNFAKGVTSQTVEVQTTQDDLFEPDETFKAVLSDPALADGDPGTGVSIESGKGTATGTIKNDDTEPSFAVADASASEGDGITFTVTRSGAMDNAVSVKWNTKAASGDGAASTSDYSEMTTATKLDFAKGESSQTFTVATTEDALDEENETFLVELTGAVGATIATAQATGTITDDDAAPGGITLSVDTNGSTAGTPSTVAEDAGATVVTVTATVNGETRYVEAKTVAVSVADGTAASPADYAAVSGFNITIAAGAASQSGSFTVTPVDDDLDESNETIDVTGTLTDITITGATVTLTDNDDPVSFSIADAEATEGGKVMFTVSRAGAEDNVASVKIATAADSGDGVKAADADDYTAIATAQTLNFAKGVTSQTVEVQTTQDDLFEPDETFKAVLSDPALADGDPGTGVSIESGKGTATGTIKNDDTEPSFAVADASASEGDGITFTVTRSGAMDNAVSVKWNTKADTAAGAASTTDYTPVTTATTLTFAKGVRTQTFTVATTEDALDEENETFLVELTGAVGATIATAQATGTITDDDAAPGGITLSVDTNGSTAGTPSTVAEDAGATVVTVTATVNGETRYVEAKTVAVSVADGTAASPADYAAVSGFNITIAAGAASQSGSFTVTPVDDDLDESNETIDVTGTLTDITITGATVTLTDNDDPVSFSIADAEATEGGKVMFTVSRAGAEDNVASVKIATAADSGDGVKAADADDYTAIATAQTLNFAKGVTSQTVEVQTTQDDLFEPDETFKAVLSDPALADGDPGTGVSIESGKGTATGTIKNDDTEPSFAVADASASEGDGITFTVTRSGAMDNAVSVKWNTKADTAAGAASTTDYTPVTTATTLTFAKGVRTQTFTVATTEDALDEENETFLVELTGAVGATIATAQATGTITDDDAAPGGITLSVDTNGSTAGTPSTVAEDAGATVVTVTATVNGETRYVEAKTVAVSVADGTAASPADYAAVSGFNITIAAGAASQSGSFTVTPVDDDLDESNETIDVTGTLTDITITGATVTLTDNDDPVSFSIADAEATEGGKVMFTVSRAGAEDNVASVKIATAADSGDGVKAADADDYTAIATAQTLNFAKGVTSQTVEVQTTQDDLFEPDETFKAVLSDPALADGDPGTGVSIESGKGTATGTIKNDDTEPSFAVADASASEGDGITFTVTRSGAMDNVVSVKWNTKAASGDGAASTSDYSEMTTATKLDFAKGESSQTFTVATTEDTLHEGDETFLVELTAAEGGTISDAEATGTISDDDAAPTALTLTVDADTGTNNVQTSLAEDGGAKMVRVTATLGGSSTFTESKTVTVEVGVDADSATEGADYTNVGTQSITLNAGSSSGYVDFTLTPTQDVLHEGSETISLAGTLTGVAVTDASITLTDDDAAPSGITLSVAPTTIGEGADETEITVTATVNGTTRYVDAKTVTVSVGGGTAISGTDYDAVSNFDIIIAAGDASKTGTFDLEPMQDDLHEGSETIDVTGISGGLTITKASITLSDDDGQPSFAVADASANEGETITFTVTRSGATENAVSVKWNTKADTGAGAAATTDYTAMTTATKLDFASGVSSQTFTVATTEDNLHEGNETFLVELTEPVGAIISDAQATGTITDDDAAPTALTLSVDADTGTNNVQTSLAEDDGAKMVRVTATLSGSSTFTEAKTVTVEVGVDADSAEEGTDYANVGTRSITINAGALSGYVDFPLTPTNDDIDEPNEGVSIEGTLTGVTITGTSLTITDDDATPTATLVLTPTTINESGTTNVSTVTVTLSGESSAAVTVEVSVPNTAPVTLSSNTTLTITAGAKTSTGSVTITAVDNDVDAPNASVVVSGAAAGGGVANPTDQTLTITDDEGTPTVTLVLTPGTINETGATNSSTVTATLSGKSNTAVTLTVAAAAGAATAAGDFTLSAATSLMIAAGATTSTGTVTITAVDNDIDAPNKAVTVSATAGGGGVANPTNQTLTITDDEDVPTVTLVLDPTTINESGDGNSSTVTATLSGKSSAAVTVTVSVPNDAPVTLSTNATLSIAAGATSSTGAVTITAADNDVDAANVSVLVSGVAAGGGVSNPGSQTLTITDDEGTPTVSLVLTPTTINESGATNTSTVTATLSGESSTAVTLTVAAVAGASTAAGDFTLSANKTLTIAAGAKASSGAVTITAVDNDIDAPNKTVTVSATASGGSVADPTNQTLTITDDDAAPSGITLTVSPAMVGEEDGETKITVTATVNGTTRYANAKTVTVSVGGGTAISGTDYDAVSNFDIIIAAGDASKAGTFDLMPTDDVLDETNETFNVSGTSGSLTITPATITITDDDAAPDAITISVDTDTGTVGTQTTIAEDGGAKTVRVTATITDETRFVEAKTVTVEVGKSSDSATEGTDYTNVVTQSITINAEAASGYVEFLLTPTPDMVHEEDETISLDGMLTGVTVTDATIKLTNVAVPPTGITLSVSPATVGEEDGVTRITVTATVTAAVNGSTSYADAKTVTVSVGDGTATSGTDYNAVSNFEIIIDAGQVSKAGTFDLTPTQDNLHEGSERIDVTGTSSGVPSITKASITLEDDDIQPSFAVADASASEGDAITFAVTRSGAMDNAVSVKWNTKAASGAGAATASDYTRVTTAQTLTFAKGVSSRTFTVATTEDTLHEGNETFLVELTAAEGATISDAEATGTITDDDAAPTALTLSVDADTGTNNVQTSLAEDGGAKMVRVTVTLGGSSTFTEAKTVTVEVGADTDGATKGTDYTTVAQQSITINAGSSSGYVDFTITPTDDDIDEPNEGISIEGKLSSVTVTGTSLTLTDDEDVPTVTLVLTPTTINESGATNASTVTALLSGKSSAAVTVEVSVPNTAPVTLSSNTILSIAAGAKTSTGTVTITAVDNNVDAPNETVTVSAAAIGGVAIPVIETLTINDDDVAPTGITLSVSPATIREKIGETEITVTATVNGTTRYADAKTVTVSVSDGTATSGMDYDAVSNFDIIIAAGDTSITGTFDLMLINDAVQEKDETIEITGSSGALNITKAMITITNSDPMPAAWLGRFGRTVAEQALDGIAGRIAASRSAGVQGSIAGHALNFDSPYSGSEALPRLDPRAGAGGTGVESSTTNDTTTLNSLVNNNVLERSELTLTSGDSGIDAFDTDGQTSRSYTLTARELLLGSSFTATGEKDVSGGSLASWGRTAQSSFDGREGTLSLDGEATTTMLGVDYARDHWLVGMALMQSNGKGGYQDSETELRAASPACSTTENGTEQGTCNGAVRDGEGEIEATLTAVTPYAAIQTSENLKLWGTLGHGTGEVTLTPAVGDPLKADISWTMAAVGLRSDIIVPRKNSTELGPLSDSGLALALTADALWARTSSNRTQDMVASDSDVTRLRFGLEGSYQITLKQGGSVTPRLEVGVRQDGGSAETGLGIELVGGLSWLDPTLGLSIDLSGRTLIVHSSDDLKNQSFAVAFAWDPDPATQRGPSLKFSQQWGTIALGGLDTPFGPDSIEDLGDSENTARWQADAAWGFPIFGGTFTGSPHVGVGLASDTRDYSLGWRLTPAANANAPDLSFAVKATRQESDTAPPEHSIGFVLIFRW